MLGILLAKSYESDRKRRWIAGIRDLDDNILGNLILLKSLRNFNSLNLGIDLQESLDYFHQFWIFVESELVRWVSLRCIMH
jgi:hypothetical protein